MNTLPNKSELRLLGGGLAIIVHNDTVIGHRVYLFSLLLDQGLVHKGVFRRRGILAGIEERQTAPSIAVDAA